MKAVLLSTVFAWKQRLTHSTFKSLFHLLQYFSIEMYSFATRGHFSLMSVPRINIKNMHNSLNLCCDWFDNMHDNNRSVGDIFYLEKSKEKWNFFSQHLKMKNNIENACIFDLMDGHDNKLIWFEKHSLTHKNHTCTHSSIPMNYGFILLST